MRTLYGNGVLQKTLAKTFKVSQPTVSGIIGRRTYKDVSLDPRKAKR